MKLGLLVSPLSSARSTRLLASAAHRYARDRFVVEELEIASVPSQPPYADVPIPIAGLDWKLRVSELDGLIVLVGASTRSLPGALKAALDWSSQPARLNTLEGMPCAIAAVSEGAHPSFLALQQARSVLVDAGASVMGGPDIGMRVDPTSFTPDGLLEDPLVAEALEELLRNAAGFVAHERRAAAAAQAPAISPVAGIAVPAPIAE